MTTKAKKTAIQDVEVTTNKLVKGLKYISISLALGATAQAIYAYSDIGKGYALAAYEGVSGRIEQITAIINPKDPTLPEIISTISKKYQIPEVALKAMVLQESTDGKNLYRFEEGKFQALKTHKDYKKMSSDELRMMASSHGVAHVMGFTAREVCGVHWSQLYNQIQGLDCGAKVLKLKLDKYSREPVPSKRLMYALRDYNGSGTQAENYAKSIMLKIGEMLFNEGVK